MVEDGQSIGIGADTSGNDMASGPEAQPHMRVYPGQPTLERDSDESYYYIPLGGPFSFAVKVAGKDPEIDRQWAAATLVDNLGLPPRFALIGTGRIIRSQRSEATSLVHQEQPVQASVPQEIPQP